MARMGYCWRIGSGTKVRFWEYNWLGSSSLAIQYWKLYRIVNEKNMTMAEIWDGENLKCTFTRTVYSNLEEQWWEVVQLASTINFSEEDRLFGVAVHFELDLLFSIPLYGC